MPSPQVARHLTGEPNDERMPEVRPRLRRRDVLRGTAATLTLPLFGSSVGAADATTAPDPFEPLGTADVQNAKEAVVGPDGDYVFVATVTGFVTVDVRDPSDPNITATEQNLTDDEGNRLGQVFDVKYEDGRLLVASAAQGGRPRGFYVYDVTDPTAPSRVGDWYATPDHGIHNCSLDDGVAYLTGNAEDGRKVVAVDVSEPPFEHLGEWQPSDWNDAWSDPPNTAIHDLYAQGDYVYAAYWDAGTFVLDKSDPANMSFVSRVGDYTLQELRDIASRQTYLEPKGNDHYVTVNEDASIMAEGGESWDVNTNDDSGGPSGITLYDISDAANPERLAHVDAPTSDDNSFNDGSTWTTSHNFDIQGGRLYASWYQGGVSVHDISDPANPERIAWWMNDDRAFWTAQLAVEGEFFVASAGGSNGTTTGLLTFSDGAGGRMPNPPENVSWETEGAYPDGSGGETTSTPSTDGPGTTATPDGTQAPTTAGPATTADGATEESDEGGSPGPGVLGALASVGVGAYLLRKRRRDDE